MNWKLIWRGINKPAMRNKLLAVLGILIVYRMLSHIPIPLAEPTQLKQFIDNLLTSESTPQIFSVVNVFSGGALASLSIMLVGLGPYINASIAMQVLARAIPKLETMQKEGEYGRKKINQYTRIITLPIAILYSFLSILAVRQLASRISGLGDPIAGASWFDWMIMVAALTGGAMILMWLGELITERSIGNGISLLITVAIVSQLPFMFASLSRSIVTDGFRTAFGESAIIESQSANSIIAATPGLTDNTFKALDQNDATSEWHYIFLDGDTACSDATDFNAAGTYIEGSDIAYTADNADQKICFRASSATATAYAASPLITDDEEALAVAVDFGTAAASLKADDDALEATEWQYAFIDAGAACGSKVDFEAGNIYSEGSDLVYTPENDGQKICFRSRAGAGLSIFGWFNLPLNANALFFSFMIIGSMVILTVFVVYLNEAHRKIKLSYAKKTQGNRVYSDVNTFLPLKLISAGVVPIIFALAFLSTPQWVGQIMSGASNPFWSGLGADLARWFALPGTFGPFITSDWTSYIYPVVYFLLVVVFTYFYTGIVFSAKDISERLQRQGGFIEGVRPGEDTQKYLSAVVNRLNFFGAISLGFLALTPILAQVFLGTDQLALGGTSILILVAVALETLRQIESQALVVTYEDYEQDFSSREQADKQSPPDKKSFFKKRKKKSP